MWRQDISQIAMDWLEDKLPMPSVAEILLNNIGHINESAMVHSSFFYAKNGGSQFLADTLARGLKVRYRQEAVNILPKDGKWLVQGELFDRVVFTGNVRQLGDCFPCVDELRPFFPRISELRSHGTTSVLCRISPNDYSWIYMPSPSHRSHRIICTGNFSRNNNNGDITTATIEFSEQMTGRGNQAPAGAYSLFPCVSGPSLGRIYLSRSGCFQPNPHTGTKGALGTERHLFIRPFCGVGILQYGCGHWRGS